MSKKVYTSEIQHYFLRRQVQEVQHYILLETPEKESKPEYKKEWWLPRLLKLSSPIFVHTSTVSDYVSSLSDADQLTVYSYTEKIYGGGVHNYWLRGSDRDKEEVRERLHFWPTVFSMYYNRYFPYYVQLRRVLTEKQRDLKFYLKTSDSTKKKTKAKVDFSKNAEEAAVLRMLVDGSFRGQKGWTEEWTYRVMMRYLHRFTAKLWDLVLKAFVEDMNRIIEAAPLISHRMVVYRGEKGLFYDPTKKRTVNLAYLSTSRSKEIAQEKVDEEGCCMLEMIIEPGVKAINVEPISALPQEQELLLGVGHVIEVLSVEKPYVRVVVRPPPPL